MAKMSLDHIAGLAASVNVGFERNGNTVDYYETFNVSEDSEPHDVAWSRLYDANEALQIVGLRIVDSWSDNDSLGGVIVPLESGDVNG
jgi:hypothetical protein